MTAEELAKVAVAIYALKTEAPASTMVTLALTALESLMPLPGSRQYREAWAKAHDRMATV